MKLLKKYNLSINKNISVVTTDNKKQILSHFISFWDNIEEIKEDLLPEIDSVINGKLEFNDIGADVVGLAYIEQSNTKLIESDLGHSDFELPTSDFKELIMEWLAILESTDR
ncbi:hypothetical protein SAMN04487765_1621 [Tenacibaculum sp. MAR_2010_89]|uniref:hypothetical protein n=1 Tax=Tenacibaculum sp. MAR_2010_89 TaxID=1250198 RepID=UPI00089472D2|nr:hypothetical protein [Tenacibaculum sp. MAR_2010_89]SEE16601.1 hypothetical protein SAMN04487765_1621 [Tenacibaculum sp. MAR_2010_89]